MLKQKLCLPQSLALPEGSEDFPSIAYCDASKNVCSKDLEALSVRNPGARCSLITNFTTHLDHKELNRGNVAVRVLLRKEREPLRVRALVMTIGLDLPKQILKAQTEARKPENIKKEDVGGKKEDVGGYCLREFKVS
ncbi:hypothetical protein Tco_1192502 [Tanacetum coccineum]